MASVAELQLRNVHWWQIQRAIQTAAIKIGNADIVAALQFQFLSQFVFKEHHSLSRFNLYQSNLDKWILKVKQTHFEMWTNTLCPQFVRWAPFSPVSQCIPRLRSQINQISVSRAIAPEMQRHKNWGYRIKFINIKMLAKIWKKNSDVLFSDINSNWFSSDWCAHGERSLGLDVQNSQTFCWNLVDRVKTTILGAALIC